MTIPNTIGYPEHKRCLVQVQSLSVHSEAYAAPDPSKRINPVYVGVEVGGIAVQNNFSSHIESTRFGGKVHSSQLVGSFNLESKRCGRPARSTMTCRARSRTGLTTTAPS